MATLSLESELQRVSFLANICNALVDFTRCLQPGDFRYYPKSKTWVFDPVNFVGMKVQYARARNVVLYVKGFPLAYKQVEDRTVFPLGRTFGPACPCYLESPHQLPVALAYIKRAHELYCVRA